MKEVNYYYITDERMELTGPEQAEIAVECGVRMVQYRRKTGTARELYEEALMIKKVCEGRALFVVNDRPDIALAVGADGVHVGEEDLPPQAVRRIMGHGILGVSTHDMAQALRAETMADYIGIGPVHPTSTKERADRELGIEGVLEIAKAVKVPTVAIGGIGEKDLADLARGVDMVCAVSSVCDREDLSQGIKLFETVFGMEKRRWRR